MNNRTDLEDMIMKKRIITLFLAICYISLTQVCMAITSFEQLDVQMSQVSLTSRLKKDFSGYEFVITNNLILLVHK